MKQLTKRKKILIIALAAALLVLPLVAACCAIACAATNDGSKTPSSFTKSWQSNLSDEALLREIVLPGSHDAGTYTLSYYGKTQYLSVKEQLDCGVRYFDLRVENKGGKLVIFHSVLSGTEFLPILNDVNAFLTDHPTEAVVLDFQHFKSSHDEVCAALKSTLNGKVVRNTTQENDEAFLNALTLQEARGKCVVFWGSDNDKNLNEDFIFRRNNDDGTRENSCLHSYYIGKYNRKSSAAYIKEGLPLYLDMYKRQNSGLFVLQGQLTDGLFVFGPRLRECSHYKKMNAYTEALATSENLQYINIVMRDFCNSTKSCKIIKLNLDKHTVNPANEDAFRNGLKEYIAL